MDPNPNLAEFTVPQLADLALVVEDALDSEAFDESVVEQLREDRKAFLDELVARGALASYSFV